MPGQESAEVQITGSYRVLQYGEIRIHNGHLQSGRRKIRNCGVCSKGLEGALATVVVDKPRVEEPSVAKGDGADKERDAALPSDPWDRES